MVILVFQHWSGVNLLQTQLTIIFSELNHQIKSRFKVWFDWDFSAQNACDLFARNLNQSLIFLQTLRKMEHFSQFSRNLLIVKLNVWAKIARNATIFAILRQFFNKHYKNTTILPISLDSLNCKARKIELCDWQWNDRQSQ